VDSILLRQKGAMDAMLASFRPPSPDLDLLTPDDVCALLKVKKSWLYDAVESGALEAIRLGKQLRFRPSELARYLNTKVSSKSADHDEDHDDVPRDSRPRK
jgi:excisionase family DNA binding protein